MRGPVSEGNAGDQIHLKGPTAEQLAPGDRRHAAEAEAVYREDLGLAGTLPRAQIHPDNLWSMRGLLDCLERRGEMAEARLIRQRVELAAARADLPVQVSCFCARGKAA